MKMSKAKVDEGGVVVHSRTTESQFALTQFPLSAIQLKKILVPVDFSECSNKAIQYAMPLAKQFGGELILVHVIEPYPPVPQFARLDMEQLHEARKQMLEFKRATCPLPIKTLVRVGEPDSEIIALAKELEIDLIILSTHGRKGMARVFLGSTAERVVRQAPCPVMVVREREREFLAENKVLQT